MAQELAFALINPYIIAKSRTGGVIARFMNRSRLNLVAARMFGPSRQLAEEYANLILSNGERDAGLNELLADYVRRWYTPDSRTGKPHRVMMLLFTGDNAVDIIRTVAGTPQPDWSSGETVRDTYGDYLPAVGGGIAHFEPAVFISTSAERAAMTLKLWARYSESDGGIIDGGADVPDSGSIQKTLVLLKPDNFRAASLRVGNIIDLFSRSGLKITGIRILRMQKDQARAFYGSVQNTLRERGRAEVCGSIDKFLGDAYGIRIGKEELAPVIDVIGDHLGKHRFEKLLDYITGINDIGQIASTSGGENCLALLYQGVSAIQKIRYLLGSTNPIQAEPGSVRYEFGSDIMANAAHASDSPENAERELQIVDMQTDTLRSWITQYYGLS